MPADAGTTHNANGIVPLFAGEADCPLRYPNRHCHESQKTDQLVEEIHAARFRTVPDTTENLPQGGAAMVRPTISPLPEPWFEFFNRLGRFWYTTAAPPMM
jgi:hypothetical protein